MNTHSLTERTAQRTPSAAWRWEHFWVCRSRLFLKVFFWFWLTTIVVLALLIVSVLRGSRSGPDTLLPQDMVATVAPVLANAAKRTYEKSGAEGYQRFCDSILGNKRRLLYLVDTEGRDALGRPVPPNIGAVVQSARGQNHAVVKNGIRNKITAYETDSPSGRKYVLALSLPRWFLGFDPPEEFGITSISAIVVAVTLLCLALARHIAGPIVGLSAAARRVSTGDLSTRAPGSTTRRHDELADLGTDFNDMIEKLQNLMNAHQELLASVSHELRSPLARLNVSLELLSKNRDSSQTPVIRRMEQDVARVDGLMTQLLTLSRLESGVAGEHRTKLDLSLLLQEVVADCDFEARSLMKSVAADLDPGVLLASADADALRSACENIIRNAVKFTEPGTSVGVKLRVHEGGGEAAITVEDCGPGVPDDQLQTIFQPFFRVQQSAAGQEGVGLGLAIAARAIHLHKGSLVALNRKPNGLRVEVRLPTADRYAAQ